MQEGGAENPASLVGTVLGRYRLERLLGKGGMGVVYAARHADLGKAAAIKILQGRDVESEAVRARLLREGQAASRIRHPNIVDIYDVGADEGRFYLVMELLDGEDLRSLIARKAPFSLQRTADLMVPVVSAVAAAHDLGVVHRDLKPENIFLSKARGNITAKVLDFGVSKMTDPLKMGPLTGAKALLGTPYYMSPEQAQSPKDVDGRSDQYSLGVILYECVTGRRPIDEPIFQLLFGRIVNGDFPAPRQLNPNLPVSFEQLILRAMAREPADRFTNTRALGRELLVYASERVRANYAEELIHGDHPVPTSPASSIPFRPGILHSTLTESTHERYVSQRSTRRPQRGLLIGGGATLLLGLAGALVWQSRKPAVPASDGSPSVSRLHASAQSTAPPDAGPAASVSAGLSGDLHP
jgi:serine/threonine-protein kinase